jgi:flagellin-like hook-associated protein FlgL
LDQVFIISNSEAGGRPLFAGTATDGTAFKATRRDTAGRIAAVEYEGSNQRHQAIVSPALTVDVVYGGSDVFGVGPQRDTNFRGLTGAKAGVGRDTASGSGELIVEHEQTVFSGTLGIKAGTSSSSDTLIGFGNELVIADTGSGQTVSLNGGPPVDFTGASVDLPVSDLQGRTIHLDMSDVAADAVGTTSVAGLGTVSIDGGTTKIPINFSDNQALVDPLTQQVTHVDTTEISRIGTADIEYGGKVDVFQSLVQLRDLLLHSDEHSTVEFKERMELYQEDLQVALDGMLEIVGEQSVTLENLDRLENRMIETQLETRLAIGETENADPTDVILQLQTEQNLLQFIYASASGAFDVNLLDFIR